MVPIRVEQLTKRYGARLGVERVSFEVREGSLFGFLGPNGAGKSTTIRVLMGLLRPSGGRARVLGRDCGRESHRINEELGYLPGDLRLYPWLTLRQALRMFGRVRRRDLTAEGDRLAGAFDLESNVPAHAMSRGMRQKLGIILALAHRPRLLILDEPTTGLDPLMQRALYTQLRAFAAEGGTVFFSSHTLSEVEALCDRVVILRDGRVAADEALESLRARARRAVTVRWNTSADCGERPVPRFLRLQDRRGRDWHASLVGPTTELIAWAAGQPIEDLSVEPPDLAALFEGYYVEAGAGA
ncbi:MAG: ABC transporter ATP-binding protein [Planctomycetes bacterium]|nr:ABC transporter ATP-binding protein [Planctomycetota bacterium]